MGSKADEKTAGTTPIDLGPIRDSFRLVARSLPLFAVLGLIAATGRALQVGAAGEPGAAANILLEVIVEGARVAIFLMLLGSGSVAKGWAAIRRLFSGKKNQTTDPSLRGRWTSLAVNLVIYAVIVAAANAVIYAVAEFIPELESLRGAGLVAQDAGGIVIVLFLKNLTVIPWTLAFVAALIGWFSQPAPGSDGATID